MTSHNDALPYVHGFSPKEQQRLRQQAAFAEQTVFRDIEFGPNENILEVGCGVGAQSEILLRRFPTLQLTGIDLNDRQLEAAQKHLGSWPHLDGRFEIKKMDAQNLDFESGSFDGAFLCWILEHLPDPTRALSEVRRVVRPGGKVYVTEVMNFTFFLDPYSPHVWKYWMAFNDFQYESAGDPFVGAKLGNLLSNVGFRKVGTKVHTWHLDNRQPARRKRIIEYWSDLMLSAREQLLSAGVIDEATVEGAAKELELVKKDPNAVFFYSFLQAEARVLD